MKKAIAVFMMIGVAFLLIAVALQSWSIKKKQKIKCRRSEMRKQGRRPKQKKNKIMARKKSYTAKVSNKNRIILILLAILFLLSFVLRFEPVAQVVAPILNTTPEKVMEIASSSSLLWLGGILIVSGAVFLSIP